VVVHASDRGYSVGQRCGGNVNASRNFGAIRLLTTSLAVDDREWLLVELLAADSAASDLWLVEPLE
jgi:hypothetical protein